MNWFIIIITFLGGIALFLFGIEKMSNGLQKTSAKSLKRILSKVSKNRLIGFLVGALLTLVVQSSSATSVMLISLVQAGIMQFSQTVSILLGAYLGASVTTQIIAFHLSDYSLFAIAIGFTLRMFPKKELLANIGDSLLGFGLLFYGMKLMSDAMNPLRTLPEFVEILKNLDSPLIAILSGLILTAIIQSSAASIGIFIVLASQSLINLEAGIALVIGANIGACVTAGLASINSNREAKRVALVHVFFKTLGALIFVFWIPYFADFINFIAYYLNSNESQKIANVHTIYNLALILIFLPFTNLTAKLVIKMLPDKATAKYLVPQIKYLDNNAITTPSVALNLVRAEINTMVKILKTMFANVILPFINKETPKDIHHSEITIEEGIENREKKIDYLEEEITLYLIKVAKQEINKAQADEAFAFMSIVNDIERIADIINDEILVLYKKSDINKMEFSNAGKLEIIDYHSKIMKQIELLLIFNETRNLKDAEKIIAKTEKYNELEEKYKETHFVRMQSMEKTLRTHRTHMELLDYLKKISIHLETIARTSIKIAN